MARYESDTGERVYHFEPFLQDVVGDGAPVSDHTTETVPISTDEIDTIVVPAREDGFKEVFLGESGWYAVRIHGTVRPQIKYIAAYQVAPISAITHLAPVKEIEPWKDSGKFILRFSEPASPIGPIPLVKGGLAKAPQSIRYTTRERLLKAKTLDDVFASAPERAGAASVI